MVLYGFTKGFTIFISIFLASLIFGYKKGQVMSQFHVVPYKKLSVFRLLSTDMFFIRTQSILRPRMKTHRKCNCSCPFRIVFSSNFQHQSSRNPILHSPVVLRSGGRHSFVLSSFHLLCLAERSIYHRNFLPESFANVVSLRCVASPLGTA